MRGRTYENVQKFNKQIKKYLPFNWWVFLVVPKG